MGIQLMLIAALFIAASNLCMRRSIDAGGTSKAYLVIQLFLAFLINVLLNPVRTHAYEWSGCMATFGWTAGIALAGLMAFLGKALETGPPGLTIAILNSSTVMPVIVMLLFFGSGFGFAYTPWHAVGSLLVVAGILWAGGQMMSTGHKTKWASFALAMFLFHVLFLCLMQWRALFINYPGAEGLFLSFDVGEATNQWFMPMVFLAAASIQALIYCVSEKRLPKKQEVLYGVLGGVANGAGTYFLMVSTEHATPRENGMIFPILAVTVIVLCNLWGQWLYKEKVNWWANALCVLGIIVGTVDWKALLG